MRISTRVTAISASALAFAAGCGDSVEPPPDGGIVSSIGSETTAGTTSGTASGTGSGRGTATAPSAAPAAPSQCQRTNATATSSTRGAIEAATKEGPEPAGPASDIGIADLDGDGQLDVVVSRGAPHGFGNLSVFYARQGGWHRWVSGPEKLSYGDLEIADVNRDGCLDLIVAVVARSESEICRGGILVLQATGKAPSCKLPSTLPTILDEPDHQVVGLDVGDLDGDGWLDIAAAQTKPHDCKPAGDYDVLASQHLYFGSKTGFGQAKSTQGKVAAAFTADFFDADGDGKMDVMFGGKRAELGTGPPMDEAVGLLVLSTATGRREVLLGTKCKPEGCDPGQLPNLLDVEVIPKGGVGPALATIHTNHHCEDPTCKKRSAARLFELPLPIPASGQTLELIPKWTSEAPAKEGCVGALVSLEAAHVGSPKDPIDLLFGVTVGSTRQSPGDLVVVPGTGNSLSQIGKREQFLLGEYDAFAMAVADLDRSDTKAATPLQLTAPGMLVALPEPLHHLPVAKCNESVVPFNYAIEGSALSLVARCPGKLAVEYVTERAADVVYARFASDDPTKPDKVMPIQTLTLSNQ